MKLLKRFAPILLIFSFVTCKSNEQKPDKKESLAMAKSMEEDVIEKKMNFLETKILLPALTERVFAAKKFKSLNGIRDGIKQGLSNHNYERSIYEALGQNGSFSFLKYYEKDKIPHIIFRAFGESGGLNYFDMELAKINNKVGIADMFIYTTGENISNSMAEMISKLFSHNEAGLENRINTIFTNVKQYKKNNDFENAKKEFLKLPYDIRNTKVMEVTYLDILSNVDEKEYLTEIEKLETKYADKPHFQLTLMDAYILLKQYDKALQAIDKIDAEIDSDPLLNYHRGLIYNIKKEPDTAIIYFKKLLTTMPDMNDVNLELSVIYAEKKMQPEAKKYFDIYRKSPKANAELSAYYNSLYPFLAEK